MADNTAFKKASAAMEHKRHQHFGPGAWPVRLRGTIMVRYLVVRTAAFIVLTAASSAALALPYLLS